MASKRAAPAAARAMRAVSEWIVFHCDGHRFGVPVESVREIVRGLPAVRLPGCGQAVLGLVNLRGRILTVIDLGAALKLRAAAESAGHRFLVVEHAGRRIGLAVDRVLGLTAPVTTRGTDAEGGDDEEDGDSSALAIPPEVLEALDAAADHVVGLGEWRGTSFIALDPHAVLGRFFA